MNKLIPLILLLILLVLPLSCNKSSFKFKDQSSVTPKTIGAANKIKSGTSTSLSNHKKNGEKMDENKIIIKRISLNETKEVVENRKENNIIVLDIRTPQEYQMGHIENSQNIDFYVNFKENIDKLDKNKKYLIYCRHANRTSHALQIMRQLGFTYVLEMDQGIAYWYKNGWKLVK